MQQLLLMIVAEIYRRRRRVNASSADGLKTQYRTMADQVCIMLFLSSGPHILLFTRVLQYGNYGHLLCGTLYRLALYLLI